MRSFHKKYPWVFSFLLAVPLSAQEKVETPAYKTKQATEELLRTPAATGKSSEDLSGAAKARLGGAGAESQSTKAPANSTAASEARPQSPGGLRFSPGARRDPFRPFNLNVRPSARRRENLAPLERFELGQLKLVAIIWDIKEPKAMVEDAAGLGYVVKVGTPIGVNEGKVKTIKPSEITIEEFYVDLYGAKKQRDVGMRLSVEKAE
jgi:type IV pilus assembly protein PilP